MRLRWMFVLPACYWLALFVGTHWPGDGLPSVGHSDKLLHFGAYGGLALLVGTVVRVHRKPSPWLPAIGVLLLLMAYGMLDEMLQIPIRGRYASVWDWLADTAGAATGLIALIVVSRSNVISWSSQW